VIFRRGSIRAPVWSSNGFLVQTRSWTPSRQETQHRHLDLTTLKRVNFEAHATVKDKLTIFCESKIGTFDKHLLMGVSFPLAPPLQP
jgi:hypothetical protein